MAMCPEACNHSCQIAAHSDQSQTTLVLARSHQELMEQMESTSRELHVTSERLRGVEAQRIVAVREAVAQQVQLSTRESERKVLLAALKQR